MFESRITSKGQTTLPRQVRAALDAQPGDVLRYVVLDGEVRLLKAQPVAALAGMLARPGQAPVSLDDMEAAVAGGAAARAVRDAAAE
jgi:bifunctional DNA-binding transcriptional regulator/antitoxin component of YhaV-PrlF toxin-antitoxin module